MTRLPLLALSLAITGCPDDPQFQGSDAVDTAAVDTTPGEDAEVAPPTRIPCASDCLVKVTDERSVMFAPIIDRESIAQVISFREPAPDQFHLVLRQFDGVGAWPYETIDALVRLPSAVYAAQDAVLGALHLIVRSGGGLVTEARWLRRAPGAAWLNTEFVDSTCQRTRILSRSNLFVGCNGGDGTTFVLYRLFGLTADTFNWQAETTLENIGVFSSRLHLAIVPPFDWDIDVLGRAHIAYQCCTEDEDPLRYAWWSGTKWVDETFDPIPVGPGAMHRSVAFALDGDGHPHIVHQSYQAGSDGTTRAHLVDTHFDGFWHTELLDAAIEEGGELGQLVTIERGATGRLHLVYSLDKYLVYRTWDGGGGAPSANAWSDKIVSTGESDDSAFTAVVVHGLGENERAHVVLADSDGAIWWWTPPAPSP